MKSNTRLSSGELDLMDLLWREGPLTLARAHERFDAGEVGYTTMQTRLNRLVDKGLASKTGRPAEYSAAIEREQAQAGHLDQLISKLSGGSVVPLVAQLMQDRQISRDELQELKRLIRDAEQRPDEAHENAPDSAELTRRGSRRSGGKRR